jgi:hypothetical protein
MNPIIQSRTSYYSSRNTGHLAIPSSGTFRSYLLVLDPRRLYSPRWTTASHDFLTLMPYLLICGLFNDEVTSSEDTK